MVEKILTVKANLDLPTMGPEIYDSDDDESDFETELDQINMQNEIDDTFDFLEWTIFKSFIIWIIESDINVKNSTI